MELEPVPVPDQEAALLQGCHLGGGGVMDLKVLKVEVFLSALHMGTALGSMPYVF